MRRPLPARRCPSAKLKTSVSRTRSARAIEGQKTFDLALIEMFRHAFFMARVGVDGKPPCIVSLCMVQNGWPGVFRERYCKLIQSFAILLSARCFHNFNSG